MPQLPQTGGFGRTKVPLLRHSPAGVADEKQYIYADNARSCGTD